MLIKALINILIKAHQWLVVHIWLLFIKFNILDKYFFIQSHSMLKALEIYIYLYKNRCAWQV